MSALVLGKKGAIVAWDGVSFRVALIPLAVAPTHMRGAPLVAVAMNGVAGHPARMNGDYCSGRHPISRGSEGSIGKAGGIPWGMAMGGAGEAWLVMVMMAEILFALSR